MWQGALAFVAPIAALILFLIGPLAYIVAALLSDRHPSKPKLASAPPSGNDDRI